MLIKYLPKWNNIPADILTTFVGHRIKFLCFFDWFSYFFLRKFGPDDGLDKENSKHYVLTSRKDTGELE